MFVIEKWAYVKVICMMVYEVNNFIGVINFILQSILEVYFEVFGDEFVEDIKALFVVVYQCNQWLNQFMCNFVEVVCLFEFNCEWVVINEVLECVKQLMFFLAQQ